MDISRRKFITGVGVFLATPAIVRVSSLDYIPRKISGINYDDIFYYAPYTPLQVTGCDINFDKILVSFKTRYGTVHNFGSIV
jgi:hypothetical protein